MDVDQPVLVQILIDLVREAYSGPRAYITTAPLFHNVQEPGSQAGRGRRFTMRKEAIHHARFTAIHHPRYIDVPLATWQVA